ncbi:TetR/AcrR family transcriptional regulator [Nicoliella spurrieriana]|uniref:TetR/AcrR family transcriptional regulator n=1 Tax=Nicoliella spurrieriana TaxID=2925830 RepID=A0A976RT70_9LACO|nr:TetR/AcrR family transcriptional regulator [Nicoliella spurrieriana]UQS87415.1 TetR/AcrR family transcriptional regulator [Nicoliella spurrieriana]
MLKTKRIVAEAYLRLVLRNTILNVSNDDIINESGVSRGTYYNNFGSQQEILDYVQNTMVAEFVDPIRDRLAALDDDVDFDQAVSEIAQVSVPLIYDHQDRIQFLNQCSLNNIWEKPLLQAFKQFISKKLPSDKLNSKNLNIMMNYIIIIIGAWITEPEPADPDTFIAEFNQLYKQTITGLI